MNSDRRERTKRALVRLGHRGLALTAFAHEATDVLRGLINFDGCCWLTLDPATLLPTSHIGIKSMSPEGVARLAYNEYGEEDANKLADLARRRPPAAAFRLAVGSGAEKSPRFLNILQPHGFDDELRAALVDSTGCWGGMAMYRRTGCASFVDDEAEALGGVSEVLTMGLRRALLVGNTERVDSEDAPGVIVLDRRGRVEMMTSPARRWLSQLMVNSASDEALPNVIYALAYRAQLAATGEEGVIARVRVPTSTGQWLVLHGSLLGDVDGRRTAIIIEPARAPHLAPLIVRAYGLTDREVEVAQLVMQGYSTREICQTLHVSPYTVQDHLKAIFEKIGVHSRRELLSQVFFQHYAPRLERGIPVGADGWFARD
jgi:DNA-binding CsgD family transcriptional regulator